MAKLIRPGVVCSNRIAAFIGRCHLSSKSSPKDGRYKELEALLQSPPTIDFEKFEDLLVEATDSMCLAQKKIEDLAFVDDELEQVANTLVSRVDAFDPGEKSDPVSVEKHQKWLLKSETLLRLNDKLVQESRKLMEHLEMVVEKNNTFIEEGEGDVASVKLKKVEDFETRARKHLDDANAAISSLPERALEEEQEEEDDDDVLDEEEEVNVLNDDSDVVNKAKSKQ